MSCRVFDFSGDAEGIFRLFQDESYVFFLDSSLSQKSLGRFSFIGFDPFEICQGDGAKSFDGLERKFHRYAKRNDSVFRSIRIPFLSGAVGYLGYDLGLDFENIVPQNQNDIKIPDYFFGFYDCLIAIDHVAQKLYIISTGLGENNRYLAQRRAEYQTERITKKLTGYLSPRPDNFDQHDLDAMTEGLPLSRNFTKEQYFRAVTKALEHIRRGDIYQVNLAQRFQAETDRGDGTVHPAQLYRHLRQFSPSCFGGYFDGGRFQILSSSPEEFLRLKNGKIQTRPMKGTRPRGTDGFEDKKFRSDLLKSRKDRAELLMITDLERNDLGRVCRYGSVHVSKMRALEAYQTVFQTTSSVEGALSKGKNCFDVIRACFPSGSVTGCPKIKAMNIIDSLEPHRRKCYTGSLGYIDFSGNMDFNILIRSLLVFDRRISFCVGSGIVADSDPQSEFEETLTKAKALRQAIAVSRFKTAGV